MRRNLAEPALDALVADGLVDAVEVLNAKTSLASLNRRAADYAEAHGLAAGAGSDAHVALALGAAYVEMPDYDGPQDFLAKLRDGTGGGPPLGRTAPRVATHRALDTVENDPRVERPGHHPRRRCRDFSEFLPISSCGHLLRVPWLFGWEALDPSTKKAFDVALHIGTLVAVVGYFRKDLAIYIRAGVLTVCAP